MGRSRIKEILRENIFRQHLLSEVTKKLHEEEGDGISEEELKEKYPYFAEILEKHPTDGIIKRFRSFFKRDDLNLYAQRMKEILKPHKDKEKGGQSATNYVTQEAQYVQDIVKEANKSLKENGTIPNELEEDIKKSNYITKWYYDNESYLEVREQNKEKMMKMFPIFGDLMRPKKSKKQLGLRPKDLQDKKLGTIKGRERSFSFEQLQDTFSRGMNAGLRHLTPEQINALGDLDDKLAVVLQGETPEGWERQSKGSYRSAWDDDPINKLVRHKMNQSNIPDKVARSISRVISRYEKLNNEMPEAFKNGKKGFEAFIDYLKNKAYEMEIDTFSNANEDTMDMIRSALFEYWKENGGRPDESQEADEPGPDYDSSDDSGFGFEPESYSDEDDDNHENPNYDPEDHR